MGKGSHFEVASLVAKFFSGKDEIVVSQEVFETSTERPNNRRLQRQGDVELGVSADREVLFSKDNDSDLVALLIEHEVLSSQKELRILNLKTILSLVEAHQC